MPDLPAFPTRRSSDLRAHPLHGRGKAPVEPGHPDASRARDVGDDRFRVLARGRERLFAQDRKSTRLNSSDEWMSYAVFSWKKKMGGDVGPDHAHGFGG